MRHGSVAECGLGVAGKPIVRRTCARHRRFINRVTGHFDNHVHIDDHNRGHDHLCNDDHDDDHNDDDFAA